MNIKKYFKYLLFALIDYIGGFALDYISHIKVRSAKEHNLMEAMKALEKESKVTLNTVDSVPRFIADIESGSLMIVEKRMLFLEQVWYFSK